MHQEILHNQESIVILGAGPAGSSCAIQLLKAGFKVTLLDRSYFPRDTPGETVHPGIESLLEQLGVMESVFNFDFLRHPGIEVITDQISTFENYSNEDDWNGFQLFRKDFDLILLNKAIDLGAEFKSRIHPIKIEFRSGKIISIETTIGKFEANYFIDASGRRAWLAKQLKIEIQEYSSKLMAYYGYVTDIISPPSYPKLIWNEDGWTWISQVKENLTAWVRLNIRNKEEINDVWVPEELRKGTPHGRRKAVDVTWRKAQSCCIENCFLVGDAAFVLDPSSSHGVLKAIMSGIMVAHLINRSSNYSCSAIAKHYNEWIDKKFNSDITKLRELYNNKNLQTIDLISLNQ